MARKKSTETKKPIVSYEHKGKERVNNPPVGLVTPETDPDAWSEENLRLRPAPGPATAMGGQGGAHLL